MKAVFTGPRGSGQSTLVNRILGVKISPNHADGDTITRSVLTFHNTAVNGAPFKMAVNCVTPEDIPDILADLSAVRRLYYSCACHNKCVTDEELRMWVAISPSPWLPFFGDVMKMASCMTGEEFATAKEVSNALREIMAESDRDLFIDNIVIEGHFPNLTPGGSLVDLPHRGLSKWMDARTSKELASATTVFYVLDYVRGDSESKRAGCREVGMSLPKDLPLNVCFTHAEYVFSRLRKWLKIDHGEAASAEISLADAAIIVNRELGMDGRLVRVRIFDNCDPNVIDKHLMSDLIAFIKRGRDGVNL